MRAGLLRERVAFDAEQTAPDGSGGQVRSWVEAFTCAAEIRYERGKEAVEAGGLTGTASFKVRVRSNTQSRALTTEHRMRDVRRGLAFNVREVDAITDRASVWLVVESGVAI
jgi:SPP1 family predicted phage head-tail adaptor